MSLLMDIQTNRCWARVDFLATGEIVIHIPEECELPIRVLVSRGGRSTEYEPNSSEIPNNCEPKICDTCRYYNSNIPCGTTPSACKEADKFAEEFVDGLKKLKQTEPTISKMEQVEEPSGYCNECKWYGDKQVCGRCRSRNLFAPKDEPQTDCPKTCPSIDICTKDDTDCAWK